MSQINLYHGDSLEAMRGMKDKAYSLALVDPPYGIEKQLSVGGGAHTKSKSRFHLLYRAGGWKDKRPEPEYWKELFRVSENQIICGGNYFVQFLPVSRGWCIWDKQGDGMSSVNNELIFTSFDVAVKTFRRVHGLDKGFMKKDGPNIHPCQKPPALYRYLLRNYATPGDKILDTHGGSMSIALACHDMGFDLDLYEIDEDYFKAGQKRLNQHQSQLTLLSA